jgi:hypothetical protein
VATEVPQVAESLHLSESEAALGRRGPFEVGVVFALGDVADVPAEAGIGRDHVAVHGVSAGGEVRNGQGRDSVAVAVTWIGSGAAGVALTAMIEGRSVGPGEREAAAPHTVWYPSGAS